MPDVLGCAGTGLCCALRGHAHAVRRDLTCLERGELSRERYKEVTRNATHELVERLLGLDASDVAVVTPIVSEVIAYVI